MNMICSFLPEFPFNAGDEVDAFDSQDMWCPAYILCIDFVKSKVLVTQKYLRRDYDEWIPMSCIMPANTRRFKQDQPPRINQMVGFYKRSVCYVARIKKISSSYEYIVEYFDIYNNRIEKELRLDEIEEAWADDKNLAIKLEKINLIVRIYSEYSEEDMNRLRMIPSKKYFRKTIRP